MTAPWRYRRVTRDDSPASYIVYIDNRYMGEVYSISGGWAFYDADRHITSVGTSRHAAVHTGLMGTAP